jgi:hypothetical protein
LVLATLAVSIISTGAASAAAPADAGAPARTSAVYLLTGAGSPLGFLGLEGVHRLGPMVEVSGGLGRGFSAVGSQKNSPIAHDLQWAVMPRLRTGNDRHTGTLGVGVSGGNYGNVYLFCDQGCPTSYATSYVLWANFEIGGEHWWGFGLALRYFLGYAVGCTSASCSRTPAGGSLRFPYLGIGIGYAF